MKMVRRLVSVIALSTISLALPAFAAPSAVVDVSLSPAGSFKGKTNDVKGSAVLKNGEVTAQNIVVNLKSLKTSIELRDKHTLKYLEANKYPEAVLVSAKGKNGKGVAKIRIRGIEKVVNGNYTIENNELSADFKLKLPDFKITGIKYMGVGVQDEVTIHVKVPVTGNSSPARATASTKGK